MIEKWTVALSDIKDRLSFTTDWLKLIEHLNKSNTDLESIPLVVILELLGVHEALWSLRWVHGKDKEIRLFAADCAEKVLHVFEKKYHEDKRPRRAIQAARDYANGLIDDTTRSTAELAADDSAKGIHNLEVKHSAYCAARSLSYSASHAAYESAYMAIDTVSRVAYTEVKDAAWVRRRTVRRDLYTKTKAVQTLDSTADQGAIACKSAVSAMEVLQTNLFLKMVGGTQ